MDRRSFLAALGSGAAFGAGSAGAGHAEAPSRTLLKSYVTSIAEQAGDRALPPPGTPLILNLDPHRSFDRRSVRVSTAEGEPLGYLPATDGRTIGPLLEAEVWLAASVVASKQKPRPKVVLEITFCPAAPGAPLSRG